MFQWIRKTVSSVCGRIFDACRYCFPNKEERELIRTRRNQQKYRKLIFRAMREGKFSSIMWGKSHMPDDSITDHVEKIAGGRIMMEPPGHNLIGPRRKLGIFGTGDHRSLARIIPSK